MTIKASIFLSLYMIQYAFAMDSRNCSNTTGPIFARTANNPEMKFFLYTNKNFYEGQQIYAWNNESLKNSNFNESHPTRLLVHGFKNSYFSCFNGYVKDAYLQRGDFNVFVVDWSDWSYNTNYISVASSIFKLFGKLLGSFTLFLNDNNVPFDNMYLIGHSLGAQMSGAAGQFIKPDQYNTIYALDPAGPYFSTEQADYILDSSDAKYVEQISTNMGEFGYSGVVGHAAFFPNYGRFQKYCLIHDVKRVACSHTAAYWYLAESIKRETRFCGQPCDFDTIDNFEHILPWHKCPNLKCDTKDIVVMGGEPSVQKTGTYYVSVKYEPPFATCKCK